MTRDEPKRMGLALIDWKHVGATLARETSDEQIDFFRAFLRECGTWGTRLQVETQFAYISAALTPDERDALAMLAYNEGAGR